MTLVNLLYIVAAAVVANVVVLLVVATLLVVGLAEMILYFVSQRPDPAKAVGTWFRAVREEMQTLADELNDLRKPRQRRWRTYAANVTVIEESGWKA